MAGYSKRKRLNLCRAVSGGVDLDGPRVSITQTAGGLASPEQMQRCSATVAPAEELSPRAARQLEAAQLMGRPGFEGEGVIWPKLSALMDVCGNDAPLHWMLHQRGYDLHSIRKLETETERENRRLREENAALRRVLMAGGK